MTLEQALLRNMRTCRADGKGEAQVAPPRGEIDMYIQPSDGPCLSCFEWLAFCPKRIYILLHKAGSYHSKRANSTLSIE